ncbi:fungal specific transcription factor [Diaporthe helianthi]|uniref:Fungal specific transcription factor n=1 Tax=Diaporthe helianthi TaxID=158607 RepID=A0A2P5HXD2_DIAHE|nr:fungal specific transcription factor [Diaporthe helianthi]
MSAVPRRKIGSRACDGCKIRKVRCTEEPPCARCLSIGIACTFNKRQATRGPRSLRQKTLQQIQNSQKLAEGQSPCEQGSDTGRQVGDVPTRGTSSPGQTSPDREPSLVSGRGGESSRFLKTPVSSLIIRLCIYRLRLFPVWPILDAEAVIASLLRDPTDLGTYTLANAVCAAVIVQLKLPFEGRTDDNDPATASSMTVECQRTKSLIQDANGDDGPDAGLNMVRIAFFQHIYHENQSPGGTKSLMFLREAVTVAQIMGLHRKASYVLLAPDEQQMRRRILWLLFVTERGVAMLHKLPIVLKWQASFPPLVDRMNVEIDEAHILPAFKKLVDLFWLFDQSGAFDLLTQADDEAEAFQEGRLDYLQHRLQEISSDDDDSNDVQRADICVTKCWMQAVVWRASLRLSKAAMFSKGQTQLSQPYRIVADFLSHICNCSKTALEAHGPTIELKIFEIASTLTEYIYTLTTGADMARHLSNTGVRPVEMLVKLQRLLASSRGGNKTLLTLLCARIAEVESAGPCNLDWNPQAGTSEADDDNMGDGSGETDLQALGRLSSSASYLDVDAVARLHDPPFMQLPMWTDFQQEPSQRMLDVAASDEAMAAMLMTEPSSESWDEWATGFAGTSHGVL